MEIVEQVYKGCNISKNTNGAEANRASHGKKLKGGEHALPTNLEKGQAGKYNKITQAIRAIGRLVPKNAWCMSQGTLQKSEKYSTNTPRSTPCSGHKKRRNPAP